MGLPFKQNAPAPCRDHGGPCHGHSQLHHYQAIDLFLAGPRSATSADICLTEKPIAKCKRGGNWSLISLIAWRNRRGRLSLVEPITSTVSAKFVSVATRITVVLCNNSCIKKWSETFPPCFLVTSPQWPEIIRGQTLHTLNFHSALLFTFGIPVGINGHWKFLSESCKHKTRNKKPWENDSANIGV